MKTVEGLVDKRAERSEGRMTFTFLNEHSFDLTVN
jgi:hypothetical protein